MANPQLEDGFIRISNELYEKMYQSDLTHRELKIIMAVVRFTYGFNRKDAELSLRFLSNATNIHFRHVQKIVKNLIAKKVLIIKSDRHGIRSREIQLNKDYDTWNLTAVYDAADGVTDLVNTRVDQIGQLTEKGNDQKSNTSVTDLVNSSIDQKGYKERQKTTLKTNINTGICVFLFPDELKNLKGFADMWKDWSDYRNEINKPLTPIAIKVQLSKLVSLKSRGYDVFEIISNSISNNWLDFYEPRENKSPGREDKAKKEYITDKLRWITADEPGWM